MSKCVQNIFIKGIALKLYYHSGLTSGDSYVEFTVFIKSVKSETTLDTLFL